MGNQNSFHCLVCDRGPETVEFVAREVALKHSYKRISAELGISRATIHRHAHRCHIRKVATEHASRKCPEYFSAKVVWPDGSEYSFTSGDNPFDHNRGRQTPKEEIEILIEFEAAVSTREFLTNRKLIRESQAPRSESPAVRHC